MGKFQRAIGFIITMLVVLAVLSVLVISGFAVADMDGSGADNSRKALQDSPKLGIYVHADRYNKTVNLAQDAGDNAYSVYTAGKEKNYTLALAGKYDDSSVNIDILEPVGYVKFEGDYTKRQALGSNGCMEVKIACKVPCTMPQSKVFGSKETTNFMDIDDLSEVDNLTLANAHGKISFPNKKVNAHGQNYEAYVKIGKHFVSVDPLGLDRSFNEGPQITIYDVDCKDSVIYYAYGLYFNAAAIRAIDNVCPDSLCKNITCSNNTITFSALHFTGYAVGSNANLTIYDAIDSGGNRYTFDTVDFYAEYVNKTDGSHIAGALCNITFDDGSGTFNMSDNGVKYNYTKPSGFFAGTHEWNVTCSKSGYNTLDANDTVYITQIGEVPEFSGVFAMLAVLVVVALGFWVRHWCMHV